MKPVFARILMTLLISAVAITGVCYSGGSFLAGLLFIVLPMLLLSFTLPYLLPVRCSRCRGKMRFHFVATDGGSHHVYSYRCEKCAERYEWTASTSGSSLDN